MKTIESKLPFNYKTIRVTRSRINKGLLAIPVSLIESFPKTTKKICVTFGDDTKAVSKNFTPYASSTRESRIGGMRDFYDDFNIKDGEELVIQFLEGDNYRIFTEKQFEKRITKIEEELDKSKNELEADSKLHQISIIANCGLEEALFSEFYRLSKREINKRIYKPRVSRAKKIVPASMRKLLSAIYDGKCQISGFGFLMKNGKPYFEIHHIKPEFGDHLKNLLIVSPNVHAQFTYTNLEESFDEQGWLRRVKFNDDEFVVNQIIDKIPTKFEKEVHYE
ncbi:MAG: HNH endonuclease [Deltaproteobacteria bacterium]|uniref:HNH endonuclease n=1 Tax=Candidatus Zymogenus saltonus TaxID=2844893 RepID=A0A9D8KGY9_9DELT|nr:HNH endonuclease [Candidatus Zymogenus saltonus]